MKEPITGRDLFVISVLCTGFGFLLAWALFHRWGTAPAIKPIDLPAWLQAIGSVIAIFTAIAVPVALQRQKDRENQRRDHLRARGFALMLLPMAEEFLSQLRTAKAYLRGDDGHPPSIDHALGRVSVPDSLQSRVTQLHDLGAPGGLLQGAIAKAALARQDLEYAKYYEDLRGYDFDYELRADAPLPEPDDPLQSLDTTISELNRAISAMNGMFD